MLGQPASSHTVCRPPERTSPLSSEYCGPVWARVRIHSGLRSMGVCAVAHLEAKQLASVRGDRHGGKITLRSSDVRSGRDRSLGRVDLRIFTEPQQGATYDDLLRVARKAEECGFDAFFRSDHFLAMGAAGEPGPTDS